MCIFIYSGRAMGEARKKSFKSAETNFALCLASEMMLLRSNFVSSILVAGEEASLS